MFLRKFANLIVLASLGGLGGCFAPTSLTCTNEGNAEAYVSLDNLKDQDPILIRSYAELCGFNQEKNQ